MDIKSYILSVAAAGLLCGIITKLAGKEGAQSQLIQIAAGLILMFTLIQPLARIQWTHPSDWLEDLQQDSGNAVQDGLQQTASVLAQSIKEQTQAYILDKATSMGAAVEVEVLVSQDTIPVPVGAILCADVSPYVKVQLSDMMEKDLGISGENQIWKSSNH